MNNFASRFNRQAVEGLRFSKPSLVQSQFQRDTDINYMVRRYVAGDMSVFRRSVASGNVDVTSSPDSLHACLNKVSDANTAWQELPRSLRHSFGTIERFIAYLDQQALQRSKPVETKPVETKSSESKPVDGVSSSEPAKV